MIVIFRFKIYENIVLNEYKELYQLEHFKSKYTYPFKKLTYNKDRKAYRIYSQWVSLKRLNKLSYKVNEEIQVGVLSDLEYLLLQLNK
tara:strand:+ start:9 stop:272 length:264 start_codon:yes stop_codon:yes gene_type:complete